MGLQDTKNVFSEQIFVCVSTGHNDATLWVWFTFGMGYFVAVFGLIATAEPVTFDTEGNKKVEAIRPGVTDGNGTIIE